MAQAAFALLQQCCHKQRGATLVVAPVKFSTVKPSGAETVPELRIDGYVNGVCYV